ncbi:unnamed protein product [Sphagnum jensenii]
METAAEGVLNEKWPNIAVYAGNEFVKLANDSVFLGEMVLDKTIPQEQAKVLLQMQANSSKTILLAVEGMSLLAVEAAINAALQVLTAALNTAATMAIF